MRRVREGKFTEAEREARQWRWELQNCGGPGGGSEDVESGRRRFSSRRPAPKTGSGRSGARTWPRHPPILQGLSIRRPSLRALASSVVCACTTLARGQAGRAGIPSLPPPRAKPCRGISTYHPLHTPSGPLCSCGFLKGCKGRAFQGPSDREPFQKPEED